MFTALDATRILRRDLHHPRLVVRVDHRTERWCVYERVRRAAGRRTIPYSFSDGAVVSAGRSTVVEIVTHDELVYAHERLVKVGEEARGEYLPLDPHAIVEAIRAQDRWQYKNGDAAAAAMERVQAGRARRKKKYLDDVDDRADEGFYRVRKWLRGVAG